MLYLHHRIRQHACDHFVKKNKLEVHATYLAATATSVDVAPDLGGAFNSSMGQLQDCSLSSSFFESALARIESTNAKPVPWGRKD
mmetsp:Transcript_12351/g.28150  ORF Transcript_12351/g.28150 Transcript_12351/m.28150 type:complete len:85 (-) Transcript_12351:691-945(-)